MESQAEKHRIECEQLRAETLETALKHQEELSTTLETHLTDLAQQRAQLEAAHEQEMVLLQEQLAQTKGRLADSLSHMTTRQTHEMQSLQKQQVPPPTSEFLMSPLLIYTSPNPSPNLALVCRQPPSLCPYIIYPLALACRQPPSLCPYIIYPPNLALVLRRISTSYCGRHWRTATSATRRHCS